MKAIADLYMTISNWEVTFISQLQIALSTSINRQLAAILTQSAYNADDKVINTFKNANSGYPLDYDFEKYSNESTQVYLAFQYAALMDEEDYDNNIDRYNNIIRIMNNKMGAFSCTLEYDPIREDWYYKKNLTLSDASMSNARRIITESGMKIDKARQDKAAKQRKEYNGPLVKTTYEKNIVNKVHCLIPEEAA